MAATDVVGYAWGQCTWFVDQALGWLHLKNGIGFGNASTWYQAAINNRMAVSQTPVLGAVVDYNSAYPGSQGDGHVGVVTALNPNGTFQVASDNWGGPGITHIGTSTLADVEGFIVPPDQASGVSGAQRALQMAGASPAQIASTQLQVATVGSTGSGPGQDPNSHFTFSNWNPFDPSSFLNVAGDVAGLTQVPGNVASGVGGAVGTVWDAILNWIERGFIIIFGTVILLIGIMVLFHNSGGGSSSSTAVAGTRKGGVEEESAEVAE